MSIKSLLKDYVVKPALKYLEEKPTEKEEAANSSPENEVISPENQAENTPPVTAQPNWGNQHGHANTCNPGNNCQP